MSGVRSVHFHPGGWLVVSGLDGLFRWPVLPEVGLRLGKRELILAPRKNFERSFLSADGSFVAVAGSTEGVILPWDHPDQAVRIAGSPESRLNEISISPDGKLLATGTWNGTGPAVWDAHSGALVRRLPGGRQGLAVFMPDGRHLLVVSDFNIALLETQRWEPAQLGVLGSDKLKGRRPAFSPNGRLLALATPEERTLLLDAQTGQEIAMLTSPDPQPVRRLVFSKDGETLAAATDNFEVQLWNLPALRRDLARLGLDWPDENPGEGFAPRR